MTHFSEQEFQVLMARQRGDIIDGNPYGDDEADPGPESDLSKSIRNWVKDRGYKAIINPQNKKLSWFIEAGMPDVVLFLPFGQVACFELKSKSGRLSDDQKSTKQILSWLGHTLHEIRNFKKFLEIVEKVTRRE